MVFKIIHENKNLIKPSISSKNEIWSWAWKMRRKDRGNCRTRLESIKKNKTKICNFSIFHTDYFAGVSFILKKSVD